MSKRQFQVNLRGIIDLLSNHLYSSPNVYVRELLQNAVDAIRARQLADPSHEGAIEIRLARSDTGAAQLVFQDNGIGLTEEETHRFLSTIGESSKRSALLEQRSDFIGQFGIGLLSCFLVSDDILMVTRSALGDQPAVTWFGSADGTYNTMVEVDPTVAPGTTVYINCKKGMEAWFEPERVRSLCLHFGAMLPYPIRLTTGTDDATIINEDPPPWELGRESYAQWRTHSLRYARETLKLEAADCIRLRSEAGAVHGVAYVLKHSPSAAARPAHRVYLKGMLISDRVDNLLPSWAFFVQCVVNADNLRPTASRESLYEDDLLIAAREALGRALREFLLDLRENDPKQLTSLVNLHQTPIKALAAQDAEFLKLMIDWLPFDTSLGYLSFAEVRRSFGTIHYTSSVDTFRQIAPIAIAQSIGVVNGGVVYNEKLLEHAAKMFGDLKIQKVTAADLLQQFEELAPHELALVSTLLDVARREMVPFHCSVEVKRFEPASLPVLLVFEQESRFVRTLERTKEVVTDLWAGVLENLRRAQDPSGLLCLNYASPVIRKLERVDDPKVLELAVQMLYVQALLLGQHPLNAAETSLLSTVLIDLLELGLSGAGMRLI